MFHRAQGGFHHQAAFPVEAVNDLHPVGENRLNRGKAAVRNQRMPTSAAPISLPQSRREHQGCSRWWSTAEPPDHPPTTSSAPDGAAEHGAPSVSGSHTAIPSSPAFNPVAPSERAPQIASTPHHPPATRQPCKRPFCISALQQGKPALQPPQLHDTAKRRVV